MLVLPGSIHLHNHSPSVLHLPLWVSATGRIRKSQSFVAGAGLSLGENHFPANSLTWRELLTGLTTYFLKLDFQHSRATMRLHTNIQWSASHTQSSTVQPQQSTGSTDMGFPKLVTDRYYSITRLSNYRTFGFPQPTIQDRLTAQVSGMREGVQRSHAET
jgi:hypothetical protein